MQFASANSKILKNLTSKNDLKLHFLSAVSWNV